MWEIVCVIETDSNNYLIKNAFLVIRYNIRNDKINFTKKDEFKNQSFCLTACQKFKIDYISITQDVTWEILMAQTC